MLAENQFCLNWVFLFNRTGQAVAAVLRRLQLKPQGHESAGELRLTVLEIQKWLKLKPSTPSAMKTPFSLPEKGHSPYSLLAKTIADQQRAIRMGTLPPHHQALDVLTDLEIGQRHYHQEDFMGSDSVAPKRFLKGSRRRSSSF